MCDLATYFDDMKLDNRKKRESNRESAPNLLSEAGIDYEIKNNGAHIVITNKIDYWPGTGLWIERKTSNRGRGLVSLFERLVKEVTHVNNT